MTAGISMYRDDVLQRCTAVCMGREAAQRGLDWVSEQGVPRDKLPAVLTRLPGVISYGWVWGSGLLDWSVGCWVAGWVVGLDGWLVDSLAGRLVGRLLAGLFAWFGIRCVCVCR